MINENIVNLFFEAAKKYPHKTAIIYKDEAISFSKLENEVKKQAAFFQSKGIGKGDRVLIFVPMSLDLYRIVLALFSIGATAVFLDEWVSYERLKICCQIAQCKAFVGGWKIRFAAFFSKTLRAIPLHLGEKYEEQNNHSFLEVIVNQEDTALITFTTGSTGTPKAAKRTHGFLKAQFEALIEKINPQADDIDMPVLPIVLLINLGAGSTSVIADFKATKPNSLNPEKILTQIKKYEVNRMVASPFFIKELSKYIIENQLIIENVKKIFTGGAPVFPNEAILYDSAFSNAKIEIVYGSTEAEPISSIEAKTLISESQNDLINGLNVGIPYRKTTVKIIKIEDKALEIKSVEELNAMALEEGGIGEIIVSGDHVLNAYFNNEDALKRNKIFINGVCWHRTGDSGYFKNGKLFLTGRCSVLIFKNGKCYSPFVYENFLQNIDGVEMATIVEKEGEICAVVEAKKEFEIEIKTKITSQIPDIQEVIFIKKMPRDPRHNSKIDYSGLEKLLDSN